ncbi:beta strand repeat-containing protein [Desulfoscipio gibsoniae]|uniref:Uncharacterized protein n=1 Tax=Desulfoscipio gibsoniae DSM 7213 TaxID=767817 RepID=R4KVH7_9FIRM|nr:hypothetical protein [Desulfoscipio gibsoniae]AGL03616.1 hypothetical protein Desgi_4374 [Desulfoscipio gibsoniae DSM 7213]
MRVCGVFNIHETRGFSAINANKIKVTFNKAVEDTTKATFAVKRGTVTEEVAVTWNEAKTEATLTKTGNFTPAEYTVTVGGVVEATNTVTIAAEEVKSVVINTTQLQKSATAPVSIDFINQYGEKATVAANDTKLTLTAYNKTAGVALAQVPAKFQFNAAAATLKDEVVITVMYKGITQTATAIVVNAATVGNVTLGEAVLPTGKTMFTPTGTKDVELAYTATNTLGEAYKLTAADKTSGAVQFLSSDNTILNPADISIDTNNKIKIAKFGKAGTVTLTALTPATGASTTTTVVVNEDAGAAYGLTLEKAAADFPAGSITPFYVTQTVVDKYGTAIAQKDLKTADYTVSTNNSSVATAAFEITPGTDYGKIKITPAAAAVKGNSATITVTVNATGNQATLLVTASDAAVPSSVDTKKNTTVSTNMLTGATQTLSFDVKDQYSTTYTAGVAGYTVEYTTSDSSVIAITSNETAKDAINTAAVDVKALKAGSATIKATLKKDSVAVAEKAYTITAIANSSAGLTYSVEAPTPAYKGLLSKDIVGETLGDAGAATLTTNADKERAIKSGYAAEVALYATDANGVKTLVPSSALVGGAPTITQAQKADGTGAATVQVAVFEYNNKYYVYTSTAAAATDFEVTVNGTKVTQDVKAKLEFTINADDTIKTISQDVTISKDALKAQSIEFKSAAPGTTTATDVTAITVADYAAYTTALTTKAYVWVKDQFGGYSLSDTGTEASAFLSVVDLTDVTGASNDTVVIGGAAAAQDGVITITDTGSNTVINKNGGVVRIIAKTGALTDFINLTIGKENVKPTLDSVVLANGSGTAATLDVNDTITLTFSEAMTTTGNATFAMTNGVVTLLDTTTLTFGTVGVNAGTGTVAWSADGKVATLTFTAVTDATTAPSGAVTPGAVVLKDANGNLTATTASAAATGTF